MSTFHRVGGVLLLLLLSASVVSADYFVAAYATAEKAKVQAYLQEVLSIEGYLPEDSYLVSTTEEKLLDLQEKGYLTSFQTYYAFMDERVITSLEADTYLIHLFPDADSALVTSALAAVDISVEAVKDDVLFVSQKPSLEVLQSVDGIKYVGVQPSFSVFNENANAMSGVPTIRSRFNLYGQGHIVAVADTGLDTGVAATVHEDIRSRVLRISKVSQFGSNPADENGHGTHVTGTILGDGSMSGSNPLTRTFTGSHAGVAPEAQVIAQDLGDDTGSLSIFPPFPISLMYSAAYQQGASVHSNSWGSLGSYWWGKYGPWAQETDVFTNQNRDMVIVYAAGNSGYSGMGTVTPPSTAKNVLAVGALDRTPHQIAGFSGRGYASDGRIKPDIMAPGVSLTSTRSSVGISCAALVSNPMYCISSGTSMATPHVSGILTLMSEYYQVERNHATPSFALLKATAINGAQQVGSYPIPSPDAGWGRIDIDASLPADKKDLAFFDENVGLWTGQEQIFTVTAKAGKPFTATLVWNDVPGPQTYQVNQAIVNDLDLVVVDSQGMQFASFDRINTVEQVRIPSSVRGTYTLKVQAANVPIGPQDFALVISYDHGSADSLDFKSITGKTICQTQSGQPC